MGVIRIFKGGGWSHIESYKGYSPDCHLNIVDCLLTKRLTKGGSRAPQDPPGYALADHCVWPGGAERVFLGDHWNFSSSLYTVFARKKIKTPALFKIFFSLEIVLGTDINLY